MFPLSSKEYKLAIEIVKLSHKNFKNYGIGLRMVEPIFIIRQVSLPRHFQK